MQKDYTGPIAKLLDFKGFELRSIGEPWPDYSELGLTKDHIPELIRMTMDDALNNANHDSLEVWAPLHAWRALGQLGAVEAIKPLVRLFDREEHDPWLASDLPQVFSLIGPVSIPEIAEFMADNSVDEINRISAPTCFERIALDHPDHRDACITALVDQLALFKTNGPSLNAFIIVSLTNLKATAAIDAIRKAYSANCVDLVVMGDVEDVEIEMGLRLTRETPPPDVQLIPGLPRLDPDIEWGGKSKISADMVVNPFKNVGRNDPCPCGSGNKFKKCCLH